MAAAPISRAERSRRARDAILSSAAQLFGEYGFEGTSLDEIAAQSGTKRSLILYHFSNKEQVWTRAVERVAELFHARMAERLAGVRVADDAARMRAMIAISIDVMIEIPQYGQILVREGGRPSERLDWLMRCFSPPFLRLADPVLTGRIRSSLLRNVVIGAILTITTLGPLVNASLTAAGEKRPGISPLSAERRDELVELLMAIMAPQGG